MQTDSRNPDIYAWQPLEHRPQRQLTSPLGDRGIERVGAFGTCGNPKAKGYESWRHILAKTLDVHKLAPDYMYNPEVLEWRPEDAIREGHEFSRDMVLAAPVTNQTEGAASIMELGMAAYMSGLRGQYVFGHLENDDKSPEKTKVARQLLQDILEATKGYNPFFTLAPSVEAMSQLAVARLVRSIELKSSHFRAHNEHTAEAFVPGRLGIYLSGTSGQRKPDWMRQVHQGLRTYGIQANDSYRDRWGDQERAEELQQKLTVPIQLIAITGETESLGAMAEMGPRLLQGDLHRQAIGLFIENHPSAPNSTTNRTRTLLREHIQRFRGDFPDLPVFMAENLEQLVLFGVVEHWKRKQIIQLGESS